MVDKTKRAIENKSLLWSTNIRHPNCEKKRNQVKMKGKKESIIGIFIVLLDKIMV